MISEKITEIARKGESASKLSPQRLQKINSVAHQFESIFASMMLKSMRSTISSGGLIPQSRAEKIYTEMLDDEYAKMLSNNGNMGLADILADHLKEMSEHKENKSQDSLNNLLLSARKMPWETNPEFLQNGGYISRSKYDIKNWQKIVDKAAEHYGVDSNLISAVIKQESAGNPFAISPVGAKGLMQLMDTTARKVGVTSIFNPEQNIMGGTNYLSKMLKMFGGDEKLALAAYNAGPYAVKKHNGVPPYKETINYVEKVMNFKRKLETKSDN